LPYQRRGESRNDPGAARHVEHSLTLAKGYVPQKSPGHGLE